ncbi:MAG: phage tail tube protein [Gammaproteobacteria bacterium]
MPDPIKWRSTIALAKIETTYGTDAEPVGSDGMLMTDVQLRPQEGEDVGRELEFAQLGNQGTLVAAVRAVLSGATELVGSGTAGTAPKWGVLARACALAETTQAGVDVVYNPVSDDHESATFYFWKGGTRHVLLGARGTGVIEIPAQGVPRIRWTFTGLYVAPSEETRVTPDLSGFEAPIVGSHANTPAFTVGGESLVLRNFQLDLANDVQPRLLIGREDILIVDRAEVISASVEAVPLTTFDPFAAAKDKTEVAVSITHGTAAGKISTIAAPKCEVQRMTGLENQQGIVEWPLSLSPKFDSGDDQFTITLT